AYCKRSECLDSTIAARGSTYEAHDKWRRLGGDCLHGPHGAPCRLAAAVAGAAGAPRLPDGCLWRGGPERGDARWDRALAGGLQEVAPGYGRRHAARAPTRVLQTL